MVVDTCNCYCKTSPFHLQSDEPEERLPRALRVPHDQRGREERQEEEHGLWTGDQFVAQICN